MRGSSTRSALGTALTVLLACTGCTGLVDGGAGADDEPRLLGPADNGDPDAASPAPNPDGGPIVLPDPTNDAGADAAPTPDPDPDPDPMPDPDPDPPPPTPDPIPLTAHCLPVAYWGAAATAVEDEVLRITNQHRAAGAMCGGTYFGPVPALTMNPALRCAARLHSMDMDTRNYFAHTNLDGVNFADRITQAGYTWGWAGENIVAPGRNLGAAGMMNAWMNSPGHCENIMAVAAKDIGIGASPLHGTQDFGAPL